jgi:4-hydroxybenzoate polyprenyltransferase
MPTRQVAPGPCLAGHLAIMRVDHWFKNVFAIPGVIVALTVALEVRLDGLWERLVLGTVSLCLVASSNYVINELLDAPSDRAHPTKSARPVPSGRVHVGLAWLQWLALMVVSLALGTRVSTGFVVAIGALWVMGCVYNVPPIRTKDVPYLDVLSESVNNPLRLLAGWYVVDPGFFAPGSFQLSYWMVGAYFMAVKRYAEFHFIRDASRAAVYRASFAHYTSERLMTSIMFYAASAMLFFGIFIARYRLELILSFPFVALVMALYLRTGLKPDSPAQNPERLYREPALMASVVVCALVMLFCLVVDVPLIDRMLAAFPRSGYGPL